jgi:S-adenosylmethionine-dependent methyltransferase
VILYLIRTASPERMKEVTVNNKDDLDRFRSGAAKYAAYLETPEGRLRLDLAFANLQEILPQSTKSLQVLDIGGGTGALAVRLAELGHHVTVLDASQPMLDLARQAALNAAVADRIALKLGDADQLASLFNAGSFDVVVCHNILEYVGAPAAVLRGAARLMRHPAGLISVLVRSQAGEVLKAAIKDGDLAAAETGLTAASTHESLYGGPARLFSAESVHAMFADVSLAVVAERGVRVVSDYLPPQLSRTEDYDRIFALERELGRRPEFARVARYTQFLASCATPSTKEARR